MNVFFKRRVLWHVLFWIAVYVFYSIAYGSYQEQYYEEFVINFQLLPARIFWTYIFIYLILPILLEKRRYVPFIALSLTHAFIFGMTIWLMLYFFAYCQGCVYESDVVYPIFYWPKILGILTGNYAIPATAAAIVIFKKYYRDQLYRQELEKGKFEAELKYLKAQIHPHFLFNTLNNLYALTLKKSDKTPDLVLRLSEMLDYMLYNSNEEEVKLNDEIKHIRAYLELEKIRYGERLNLDMNIHGDASGKYIAPLILLPFVENSFKHGASENMDVCSIRIQMHIREAFFQFMIENSYQEKARENGKSEGIGLENVKRRLELVYPDRHNLTIEKKKELFSILLTVSWNYPSAKPKKKITYENPVLDS